MGQRLDIKPADVFVSFTGADRQIKNRIIEFLKSKNISYLESDKECCGNYIDWSLQAPWHCKLFLPIITKNVRAESIMKDEYDSLKKQEDYTNRIIPICTDIDVYEKYSFGMHENCSAVFCDDLENISEKTLEEVYSKIEKLLIHIICREKFNPIIPSEHFVGRDNELQEIHRKLQKFNTVFVSGVGGMGKTELVKKYVKDQSKFEESFFNIIYLQYNKFSERHSNSKLESVINSVVKGMPIADKKEIFNHPKTLVILDNFDVEDDEYLNEFLSFNCKKIITTRNDDFKDYENAEMVKLDVLSKSEQHQLFEEHYGYEIDSEDKNLEYILKSIVGLTVFIPIIAKQCKASKIGLEEMCNKLKGYGIPAFKDSEEFQVYKDEILLKGNTLQISRIIFKIANLEEKYKTVLRNLSLLQFMYVNAAQYKKICLNEENILLDDLNYLISKNWVIEIKGEKSPEESTFELHPIINELVREDLKPNPDNCPEVFGYVEKFNEAHKNKFDEINFISSRHISLLDKKERTQFIDKFINNLNMSEEKNVLFAYKELQKRKYSFYGIISDAVLNALKKHILDKECYTVEDYNVLSIISQRIHFTIEETKNILNSFDIMKKNAVSNEEKIGVKQMTANILQNIVYGLSDEKINDISDECSKYDINLKKICETLYLQFKTIQGREFYFLKEIEVKILFVRDRILKAENYKESLEEYFKGIFFLGDANALRAGVPEYLSAILCEKYVNKEMLYEDVSKFEDFLYSEIFYSQLYTRSGFDKSEFYDDVIPALLRQFLICYAYNRFTGMKMERCKEFIKEIWDYIFDGLPDGEKIIDIIAHYYCGDKVGFEKKLEQHFVELIKISNPQDILELILKHQRIFEEDCEILSDYLLNPVVTTISYLEQNFAKNKDYQLVLERWYKWAVDLAEDCGKVELKKIYSEKREEYKNKLFGVKLR